jgi:multidrug transporter EmrE-like cation transporter
MNKLLLGSVYGILAQILTFLQLQGNIKYNWFQKAPILTLLVGIPMAYLYIKSVENFVLAYDGQVWPSRLLGFGIGMIVFGVMSYTMFDEPVTLKTTTCLALSVSIILVQILWK